MDGAAYLEAVVLGIVQGITEFLPISSSGHLVILSDLIQRAGGRTVDLRSRLQMNVAVHLGTLLSVLVVYRAQWVVVLRDRRLCLMIVVATLPVAVVGLAVREMVEQELQRPLTAGMFLLVTAGLLAATRFCREGRTELRGVTWRQAAAVGVFQALALAPGISRSGSTIAGALFVGLGREAAAAFSFLIAAPAILGAVVLTATEMASAPPGANPPPVLLTGAAVSFAVGWLALKWLLRVIARGRLHWFAWYCAAVGGTVVVWQWVR